MKMLIAIMLQVQSALIGAGDFSWIEKVGFTSFVVVCLVILWRKLEKSEAKNQSAYLALLERVISMENTSTKALERNNELLEHLTDVIEQKLGK